jgi:hypothetical protein
MNDKLWMGGRYWTVADLAEITEPLHVKGDLDLRGYNHPLPAALASIGSSVDLEGYNHPLPAALASIGGYVDLRGYNHPLPAALASIGGPAYLEGYNHPLPAWLIDGGADSRGYYFAGMLVNGEWRIRAGCRDFSIDQARRHWGSGGQSDRPDCLALVEKIVTAIEACAVEAEMDGAVA